MELVDIGANLSHDSFRHDLPQVLERVSRAMSPRTHRPWLALLAAYQLTGAAAADDLDAWDAARDELKAAERYDAMAEEAEAGKDSEDEEDGEEE